MKNATRIFVSISLLLLAAISMAETTPEPRQSLTSQGKDITRGSVVDGNVSFDEFDELQTIGGRTAKDRRSAQQKTGAGCSCSLETRTSGSTMLTSNCFQTLIVTAITPASTCCSTQTRPMQRSTFTLCST